MKRKKILIIGYFGYDTNQIDGQTLRTRSIYHLFKAFSSYETLIFDTQSLRKSKKNFYTLFKLIAEADTVFNIAAQRNLKYFFPFIFTFCKANNISLNYVAVGGWLYKYLDKMPIHKYMLTKISNVFVQTEDLYDNLKNHGFKNVHQLNNFRLVEFPAIESKKPEKPVQRLVFLARVHPLKGIDTLLKLSQTLETKGIDNVSIDIYGPILETYKTEFLNKVESSNISYKGIVDTENVHKVLQRYDLMLFPTKYYTEGFPGSILDAYISGIPAVATNWLNALQFIRHGETGYISEFNNDQKFIDLTIHLIENPSKINSLTENLKIEREKYSAEHAWSVISKTVK